MKFLLAVKYLSVLIIAAVLASCGNDTSGSLSVGTLSITSSGCGVNTLNTISSIITFTPPAGTVPNGVKVNINVTANSQPFISDTYTYNDSSAFNYSFIVPQHSFDPVTVIIHANVNDMKSSNSLVIPAPSACTP